jgi:hypothetical protein
MITPSFGLTATERVLPRLALDFTTATLDPRITFTRAGNTATVINSSGLVQVVNADIPRFDYDPTTLVCKGLLIEESRTNICLYSEDMANAYWSGVATGVATAPVLTADAGVAPDGTNTADQLVYNLNGGTLSTDLTTWQSSSIAFTSGVTQTLSVWIKTTDNSTKAMRLVTPSGTGAAISVTGDWQRFFLSATPASTTSGLVRLRLRGNEATADTASILVWGWQVENATFATSYIPTVASQVTRTADVATMTGTNFSDWYNASEGSFVAEAVSNAITVAGELIFGALQDSTNYLRLGRRIAGGTSTIIYGISFVGTTQAYIGVGTAIAGTPYKTCFTYKQNNFNIATNGSATVNSGAGNIPATPTQAQIGSNAGSLSLNGYIKKLYYYSIQLTSAETQAFSK